ncbi:Vacuolar protein sorting-associated protein 16 [Saitoella coloradoensis]
MAPLTTDLPHPTTQWSLLQERFYRKVEKYTLDWHRDGIDLDEYHVVGASCGGAIALIKDENRIQEYTGKTATRPAVLVYSASGRLIRKIQWDKSRIRGAGWSDSETLILLTETGIVRCYDLNGDFSQFTLGKDAEDNLILSVRFWSRGLVALLGNNRLISISRLDEPRPRLLASPGLSPDASINAWSILPPEHTLSRHVECLLATDGGSVLVVDAIESQDQMLTQGPFSHVSVSPDGAFVALYNQGKGKMWVVSADFQRSLSEWESGREGEDVKEVVWCGNDAVVVTFEGEVVLVGPSGGVLTYYYDSTPHLLPEIDGVSILTTEHYELLHRVPDSTAAVFSIGSTHPSSILLDALTHLHNSAPQADAAIQLIRPSLAEAVDTCVKAAGVEWDVGWQKRLLEAAGFGKSYLEGELGGTGWAAVEEFVGMCESLRVLNAVRYYETGIPISWEQYQRLGPEMLIERLLARRQHFLALKVAESLHLSTEGIYVHWACTKIRHSSADEDEIAHIIITKLTQGKSGRRGMSFDEIARTAYEEGRVGLATRLLDHEPRAGRQVPLLLSMEEDRGALGKAVESGDTDLVYFVLLHLKRKYSLAEFFRLISAYPMAMDLVENYAREQDVELLKDFYYQDDRRVDSANVILRESLEQKDLRSRLSKLDLSTKLYQESKEHVFEAKALQESARLLAIQESLEKDIQGEKFLNSSVSDTIFKLIELSQPSKADKLRKEFKVPDARFWWIKIRALVKNRDWHELEQFAKLKKSPIGYEPFVNECIASGNNTQAAAYIARCSNLTSRQRVELYVKINDYKGAGQEAFKVRDLLMLQDLRPKAQGSAARELDSWIAQLSTK